MKKIYILLVFFFSTLGLLPAQAPLWHQTFLPAPLRANYCKLQPEGDQYLIYTDQLVAQIDRRGTVTGLLISEEPSLRWTAVLKRIEAQTGNPFFIIARRRISIQDQNIRMGVYKPGVGLVQEIILPDSLGSLSSPRPFVRASGSDTYTVFGLRFYRQVRYTLAGGLAEEWVRPLDFPPVAVQEYNGGYILTGEDGQVQVLDAAGNQIWLYSYPIKPQALAVTSSGFVLGGSNASGQAVVLKLHFDGTEHWLRAYPDKVFNAVLQTTTGGFAAAGLSDNGQILLVKLDATGSVLWKRTYVDANGSGGGAQIQEMSDGGFLLLGQGKPDLHCIRTDENGLALEPEPASIRHRQLKTGGLQSDFYASPTLFFNGENSTLMPVDTNNATTLFACSPWIAGVDPSNTIRVAANDYFPSYPSTDYRPGTSEAPSADFDRVWAVSRQEIQDLRTDFLQDQSLQEDIPFDVLTWPGKGNPFFEYNLDFTPVSTAPLLLPAPFVDVNNDGLYNVYDGDYPLIKGDQMAWWAITDSTLHTKSFGDPLVVDLQVSAYLYECASNPIINQTLFVDYDLINRSGNSYTDAYFGFFADPDLGCFTDDYIGTVPQVDSWYVYNEDDFDADCQGVPGFGSTIPVQSMSYLNVPLSNSIYYNSSALGTPQMGTVSPTIPLEYYRYLQGKWQDGTPLTIGGSGYNLFNLDITNYAFHDNPADPQGWTLCTEDLGFSDRRVVSSHGPIDLAPGGTFQIQLAFTLHTDIPHPCPDIFNEVVPALEQLQQWHTDGAIQLQPDLVPVYTLAPGGQLMLDATVPNGSYNWSTNSNEPTITIAAPGNYSVTVTGITGCTQVEEVLVQQSTGAGEKTPLLNWELWPNPANAQVWIDCPDCVTGSLNAVIYNAQGQVIREMDQLPNKTALQVEKLPAGLYWVKLRDRMGTRGVKRMVVQR